MKYLRYYSEFKSLDGANYRVELLQEAAQAYDPQEIKLAADPVTIEWGEVSKLEPVMSSAATLRLLSMSDRQFVDLYTVEARAIRMDVYRNGSLYWSGTIDTELFEEPYSQLDRYITEITFSDFAVLDRLMWEQKGLATMSEVLSVCLDQSGVSYSALEKNISTTIPGQSGDLFDNCTLSLENFYDEDGEAWTIREVLDEMLRPFALQLKQKGGKIIISDTNALASHSTTDVEWRNADAQLGVEPTYNKVELTFSPYSETTLFNGEFDEEKIIPNPNVGGITTVFVPVPETNYNGFLLYYGNAMGVSTDVEGLTVGSRARLFRIDPENDGSETAGVMWGIRPVGEEWSGNAPIYADISNSSSTATTYGMIMQTPQMTIQQGSANQRLKISLDVLFDPRKNPFEGAGPDNEEDNWDNFINWVNWGAIPCTLILNGIDGSVWSYHNKETFRIVGDNGSFAPQYEAFKGQWIQGDSGELWLSYYDESDRKSNTGFGEWKTNKQTIGKWTGKIPKTITMNIYGEKIPLPPVSGTMQLSIYAGMYVDDNTDKTSSSDILGISRWLLYRNPKVEVVSYSGGDLDVEDIVYSAWLDKAAKDELPVETYIGTPTNRTPLAKGVVMLSSTQATIEDFSRAGITTSLEKLLIGTIYSNYAARHNTLAGTAKILPENGILSDKSSVNSRYILLSEAQSLERGTSEIKMAEFGEDSYEEIEYEEV